MNGKRLLPPVLALSLLCGCAAGAVEPTPAGPTALPAPAETENPWNLTPCRIVDGADIGELLLADEESGEIYTLSVRDLAVTMDGGSSGASELRDGMKVWVGHTGGIAETWPAQFAEPQTVAGESDTVDDRCGLYLQVLEDLWNEDPGLNEGALTYLGVDFSLLTELTDGEKNAVAWRLAQLHGLELVTGTWDELVEEGYITGRPLEGTDRLFYEWTDGVLFTITTAYDAAWSLPAQGEGEEEPRLTAFDAEKWRSSLGSYYFVDCTAQMGEDGSWTYSVGAQAIS